MTMKEIKTFDVRWSSMGDEYIFIIYGPSWAENILYRNGKEVKGAMIQSINVNVTVGETNKISINYIPSYPRPSWKNRFEEAMVNF